MKASTLIALGIAAGIGYALYRLAGGLRDQIEKVTEPVAQAIASLWLKFKPLPPSIELLGNVKFPGNLFVPVQQLSREGAIRHTPEPDFAVYVKYADHLWRLEPRNAAGNWPAVLVK